MTALINAMRVLTDPAETGACCIALCQDVEGESFDFPEYFFKKRVHRITRPVAVEEELEDVAEIIAGARSRLSLLVVVSVTQKPEKLLRNSARNSRSHSVRHRPERVPASLAIHTALAVSV